MLNKKQKEFCETYVSAEFFGNGLETYSKVYKIDANTIEGRNVCKAAASRMLSKKYICDYINELLDREGLNDTFVDKQLLMVITQFSDLNAKMKAIEAYNKLKQRITDKVDVKHSGGFEVTLKLD